MLGRIERLLEGAVEGTTRGLFRVRLQPVELAKASTRAMDAHQVIGPDGLEVANAYRIRLHPDDFAQFAPFRASLETKIISYLDTYARDRAMRPVAEWQVSIVSDDAVPRRRVRVDADMLDPSAPGGGFDDVHRPDPQWPDQRPDAVWGAAPSDARGLQHDRQYEQYPHAMPSGGGASYGADSLAAANVTLEDGRVIQLDRASTTIGRALDNDVVISDPRVSRYHVRLEREPAGQVARDAGSTNGTRVGGRRGGEHLLRDGDELSLGGYRVRVRLLGRPA